MLQLCCPREFLKAFGPLPGLCQMTGDLLSAVILGGWLEAALQAPDSLIPGGGGREWRRAGKRSAGGGRAAGDGQTAGGPAGGRRLGLGAGLLETSPGRRLKLNLKLSLKVSPMLRCANFLWVFGILNSHHNIGETFKFRCADFPWVFGIFNAHHNIQRNSRCRLQGPVRYSLGRASPDAGVCENGRRRPRLLAWG